MSAATVLYRSAAQTDAKPQGEAIPRFPLPGEATIQLAAYALDQEYKMLLSSFPPAAKNTPANSSSVGAIGSANAILTAYSPPTPSGAGLGQFQASFNIVPASWSDYKMMPFTFPAFPGIPGQTGFRNAFTDIVPVRIAYDYYVLDPDHVISSVADGTPGTATSVTDSGSNAVKVVYKAADIPIVKKSTFCVAYGGTPDYTNRTNSLIKSGGEAIGDVGWYQTQPTKSVYQSWISQAESLGWTGIVWPGTNNNINDGSTGAGHAYTQLVTEDSRLESFAGNILARVTMYVLAR